MQRALEHILRHYAERIIATHKPRIIAIAGSVGKTSAKEAVFHVMKDLYRCRKAEGSFNNEIGVPLTIIGAEAQGKNIAGWLKVIMQAKNVLKDTLYPEVLVLEFGEGKPGDLEYLMRMVKPQMTMVTAIQKVHLEFFKTIEAISEEMRSMMKYLPPDGMCIVNADDPLINQLQKANNRTSFFSIGYREDSTLQAQDVHISRRNSVWGLSCKLSHKGTVIPLFIPGIVARHQVYAILEACAVGILFGHNLVVLGEKIAGYQPPKGRTNLIEGIRGSLLIDDTYNASPAASEAALRIFDDISGDVAGKKIAIFGDMLELGEYSEAGHRHVGKIAHQVHCDELIVVGSLAKYIAEGARAAGMQVDAIHAFVEQKDVIDYVKGVIASGDVVLIKGSQGARMEHITKALLANPESADELLVRQSARWQQKR